MIPNPELEHQYKDYRGSDYQLYPLPDSLDLHDHYYPRIDKSPVVLQD
jgi:hypothetical protein